LSSADEIVFVDVGQYRCRAEVYLNDIPLAYVHKEGRPNAAEAVPQYMVDGKNVFKLVVEPGPIPSLALGDPTIAEEDRPVSKPEMIARARMARYRDGEDILPKCGVTLAEIEWRAADLEEPVPFPHVIEQEVDLGPQFGPWQWQTAEQLTLDPATYDEAATVIEQVAQAWERGDAAPISALAQLKHAEMERAMPAYPPGSFDEVFREEITTFSQHEDWQPPAPTRDLYDLRLVAGGRMVQAIAKDWRPAVRLAGGKFGYHFMIGRIDGTWHILR
jgi:hypothetical protein